ncbi:magnesium transporter MRS2-5-like isoform X1 [Zingiber officinale]|uniref:magnesium transporter MRS2-5-like isoform X1 n=1 Tax=Zingiber officinale TaxID=94328 RepID=UPI001C4DAC68|nr:magnesium transporter MRS2-5-like isoform X1 [Zingiber officinale]
MKDSHSPLLSFLPKLASSPEGIKFDGHGHLGFPGLGASGLKKRGQSNRSWIEIDSTGNMRVVALDKTALMKRCGLPSRDLRLLDPVFVYPSTILGRGSAIVVSLEQVRCIIMADVVLLVRSADNSSMQYETELCQRLRMMNDQNDDLPFEFKALELALEMACTLLDSQVTDLEIEVYPVLEELASSVSTANLEHVRRLKSQLLALTHRVQKMHDEIEQLMDDDGDMAEMYLTEKKERMESYLSNEAYINNTQTGDWVSHSAPASPTCSSSGLPEKGSSNLSFSKHESSRESSTKGRQVEVLEMLLEAYFVVIDSTLSKLLSLKEYIDDTEDFINIKLDNVRNQLIQFELLLAAATFVVAMFAVVTGVFGMNFEDSVFDTASTFNWVVVLSSILCIVVYSFILLYFKHKKLLPV